MKKKSRKGRLTLQIVLVALYISLFILTSSYKLNFLIWLVDVPMILLVYNKKIKEIALPVFISSILSVGFSFSWVSKYDWNAYWMSTIIFSSFILLFALIFNMLSKRINNNFLQIFIAPVTHSVLMLLYSFSIIGSYWADWSMFQPLMAPLIWLFGSYGITFLIILMSSVIAFYILKKDKKILLTGFFIVLIVAGNYIYSHEAGPEGRKIRVALLQGNFNESWNWRTINAKSLVFDVYKDMSIEASKSNPEVIVWPEYAIADDLLKDKNLMNKISELAKQTKSYLVLGSLKWSDGFYKKERNRNDIALIFGPDGRIIGNYNSVKPVPFERWVLPGNETNIFNADFGSFGVSLCYEETQNIARDFSEKGAEFLISLANNQRLDHTAGLYLVSLYPNLRAAENGKYLVRATNTGITKIVNPYGKVEAQLEPYKRGILVGDIYLNDKATFYTKYGNILLYFALSILGLFIIKGITLNKRS